MFKTIYTLLNDLKQTKDFDKNQDETCCRFVFNDNKIRNSTIIILINNSNHFIVINCRVTHNYVFTRYVVGTSPSFNHQFHDN